MNKTEKIISLDEAPQELKNAILEKAENYKLLWITKNSTYPYKDKTKEEVYYEAYLLFGNYYCLITKWEFSKIVEKNFMTVGNMQKMIDYWNKNEIQDR